MEGSTDKYLLTGEEYVEPGYRAFDENDGDITASVTIESDLDTAVPGEYHISYIACDKAGNAARERRKVTVVDEGPLMQDRLSFDLDPFYDDVICKYNEYTDESEPMTSTAYFQKKYKEILFLETLSLETSEITES